MVHRVGPVVANGGLRVPSQMADQNPTKPDADPELKAVVTAFASLAVAVVANKGLRPPKRGSSYVSRQSPNTRRRQRTAQGPGRIQARGGRKVRQSVLHHQPRWQECLGVSLRGVAAHRGKTSAPLHLQSHQEEVPEPDQLLRSGGGDGWTGTPAGAGTGTRFRRDS